MSHTNISLVKEIYGAFGRGDVKAILETLTPDVSFGMVGREQDVPMAGIRRGKEGAAEFFRLLNDTQQITRFEPQKFAAADDMVFAWGVSDWTMRRNGVPGTNEWLHVFTIIEGKVAAWRGHQDTALLANAYHAAPQVKRAANG